MKPPPVSLFESAATGRAVTPDRIAAPILFALAQDDVITPVVLARAAAARAPNAEVRTYPGGHFDIYVGATFERAVADQVEFLTLHLLGS